jgi:hypothetical protein
MTLREKASHIMSVHFGVPFLFDFRTEAEAASAEPWDAAPASVEVVEPEPPSLRTLFQRERLARRRPPAAPQYGMAEATRVLYQAGLSDDPPDSEPRW